MTTISPISVGQRFRQAGGRDQDEIVTVARVEDDRLGLSRVTFCAADGRELSAYTIQVEAALADGALTPAADLPRRVEPGLDRLAS